MIVHARGAIPSRWDQQTVTVTYCRAQRPGRGGGGHVQVVDVE